MSVLVIGATGMLGQAIMSEASRRDIEAIGAARRGATLTLDITDDQSVADAFDKCSPSIVINCAAIINIATCQKDPLGAWKSNGRAVSTIAGLCREHQARLAHVSTDHYYTGENNRRHDENMPVSLINEYSRTKFAGEAFALNNPESLVIRSNIVGLRNWEKPTFAEWAIKLIETDHEAVLFDDSFVSSIDTPACARAIFDLIKAETCGVVNVASRDVFSKKEFVETLADRLGRKLTKTITGSVRSLDVIRAESLGLDVSKAEKIIGYNLPTLAEVADTIATQHEKNSAS